jgi:endoglucanase
MKIKSLVVVSLFLLQQNAFSATPWLHVDGKQIKDPAGNRVILRGVSTESIGAANASSKNIKAVIDIVTNMNDNASNSQGWYTKIVRLPNGPGDFTKDPNGYVTGTLKAAVDYATSKGLYAIIDLHYIAETSANTATVNAFWKAVAPVFKDYSNVLFEPFNEPINQSQSWSQFKPTMQAWVDLIRTYAPKNLICCGSPVWCQRMGDAATDPLKGDNIVYVVHMYNAHWHSASNKAEVEKCAAARPMIMTEYGFHAIPSYPTETVTNYGKPITDWMESLGVSWTTWCASDDWAPAMFNGSWGLLIGDCCSGGFTKDLLFTKRNSDQPSASSPVMLKQSTAINSPFTDIRINGSTYQIRTAGIRSTMKLVTLRGSIVKEFGAYASKPIIATERIIPGVYVLSAVSGNEIIQNKIFIR